MSDEIKKMKELSDEQLMEIVGGYADVSAQNPIVSKLQPLYGIATKYGVQPLYGIKPGDIVQPLYGIKPGDIVQPLYGIKVTIE